MSAIDIKTYVVIPKNIIENTILRIIDCFGVKNIVTRLQSECFGLLVLWHYVV